MTTVHRGWSDPGTRRTALLSLLALAAIMLSSSHTMAHNVTEGDAGYIQELWGVNIIPFMYLGAKPMVTGYDRILFLLGVVFFLYRMKEVGIYVSLFAIGHSTTMLLGVWFGWGINAYVIDAIIGLSVVYKVLDNLGAYQRWFGVQPNTKAATLIFSFFHGTGLATKILDYDIVSDGLLPNLLAFNVGVEIGQLMALAVILMVMGYWRKSPTAQYRMQVEGGRVNFDLHGHGGGQSVAYEKGRGSTGDDGEIVAAFDGEHGWFWRYRDDTASTVTVQVRGDYAEFKDAS